MAAYTLLGYENGAALVAPVMALYAVTSQVSAPRAVAYSAVTLVALALPTALRDPFGPHQGLFFGGGFFLIPGMVAAVCFGGIAASNRVVARGDALLSPSVTRRLITDLARRPKPVPASREVLKGLTDRELQVMSLVAAGLSNDEIAGQLYLSPLTAKTHVSRIMTKLGARDRAQVVVIAYETGLVTPGHPAS